MSILSTPTCQGGSPPPEARATPRKEQRRKEGRALAHERDDSNDVPPLDADWLRWDHEPPLAYAAFVVYRELPLERRCPINAAGKLADRWDGKQDPPPDAERCN